MCPEAAWQTACPQHGPWYLRPTAASSLALLGEWVVTYTSLSRASSSSSLLTTQLSAWSWRSRLPFLLGRLLSKVRVLVQGKASREAHPPRDQPPVFPGGAPNPAASRGGVSPCSRQGCPRGCSRPRPNPRKEGDHSPSTILETGEKQKRKTQLT